MVEKIEEACKLAKMVFSPYVGAEKIDAICAVITGEKKSVAPVPVVPLEMPMPVSMAAKLTGLTPQTLHYHARKGRIRKATIQGSKRSIGFVAEDIRRIVQGR